mmetsp:Transcript_21830/g.40164  ORF Transcript_21830/g.40164 Transcript_21830/m.40164 type:complete len:378 (-) Transcript_21830:142-1275(-)
MPKVVSARCCGCKGTGAAEEDDESPVEVDLLEAKERSVNLAIRAPKPPSRTGIGFIAPGRSSKASLPNLELLVSVMGGPYSDINGPVEERVATVNYGARLTHEVRNLHPETEYTITVTFKAVPQPQQSDGAPLLSAAAASVAASSVSGKSAQLEVRTAAASSALFAGEDWSAGAPAHPGDPPTKGSFAKSAYSHDPKAGRKAAAGGAASSSSAAAAARQQDETSTIAPSDAGGDPARLDSVSDSDEEGDGNGSPPRHGASAAAAPASSSTAVPAVDMGEEGPSGLDVVEVTNVLEVSSASRATACNLCSMMDCMKQRPRGEEGEVIIERASAKKAAAPKKKQWRPYRTPFPGTPVDPASVGLTIPPEVEGGRQPPPS